MSTQAWGGQQAVAAAGLLGALFVATAVLSAVAPRGSAPGGARRPGLGPATTPLIGTSVIHVSPVDGKAHLRRDFTVTETLRGAACWLGSEKVIGAASCSAGHYIYDPCWAEAGDPSQRSVLCLIWPWEHTVERLLTETEIVTDPPVPDEPDVSPWAVELADGQRCQIHTGAHASLNPSGGDDADVVDYYCDDQGLGLSLLRGIDTTTPVWTARAARYVNDHYERVEPQRIATAWF